jgi:hypothetical protein
MHLITTDVVRLVIVSVSQFLWGIDAPYYHRCCPSTWRRRQIKSSKLCAPCFISRQLVHLARKYPIVITKSLVETFSKIFRGMATVWQRVFRPQGPTSAGKGQDPIAASYFSYLTEFHPPVRANYSVFAKAQTRRKTLISLYLLDRASSW